MKNNQMGIKIFRKISRAIRYFFRSPYYGFFQGHNYISLKEINIIKNSILVEDHKLIEEYENDFSNLIGKGTCISYASARMGFYELLKILEITSDDEVIILGFTCAVMINAIIKAGGKPIYSDIDLNTLGSDPDSIKNKITDKTKVIVAQHTFGIPCQIEKIKEITLENNIFLIEDCALTLGSKINGTNVGNFGDAAIFSTDHSKPINTILGGLVYTNNINLAKRLKSSQNKLPELPTKKKLTLWQEFNIERKYFSPKHYSKFFLIQAYSKFLNKLLHKPKLFISEDFSSTPIFNKYYPAKLPTFLAHIGLIEIRRWNTVKEIRKTQLKGLIYIAKKLKIKIPLAYFDNTLEIIPLRFIWVQKNGEGCRNILGKFINVSWTWFLSPVVGTDEAIENYGYSSESCPNAESIFKDIINIPCTLTKEDSQVMHNLLFKNLSQITNKND